MANMHLCYLETTTTWTHTYVHVPMHTLFHHLSWVNTYTRPYSKKFWQPFDKNLSHIHWTGSYVAKAPPPSSHNYITASKTTTNDYSTYVCMSHVLNLSIDRLASAGKVVKVPRTLNLNKWLGMHVIESKGGALYVSMNVRRSQLTASMTTWDRLTGGVTTFHGLSPNLASYVHYSGTSQSVIWPHFRRWELRASSTHYMYSSWASMGTELLRVWYMASFQEVGPPPTHYMYSSWASMGTALEQEMTV